MDLSNRFSSNGNGHSRKGIDDLLDNPRPAGESASLRGEELNTGGTPTDSARTPLEDRDAQGRFARGNKGGPGNPYNRRVAELKRLMQSVITEDDALAIMKKVLELARAGNVAALRIFHQYYTPNLVQPDQQNIEEWKVIKEESTIFTEMPGHLSKPEPTLPLMMVREARSAVTGDVGNMMANLLACPQERIPDMQNVLQHDPKTAREWLDHGVPPRRKETRSQRKARKARRGKRPT